MDETMRRARPRSHVVQQHPFESPSHGPSLASLKSLRRVLFPTAHRLLAERALHSVSLADLASVLVVGAGTDPYRALVPAGARYISMDIDPQYPRLSLVGDAHQLPFGRESFDCIIVSEVIEHLRDPGTFATEAKRVLGAQGRLVATIPFMFHIHADPADYVRLTSSGLGQLFGAFSRVEVLPFGRRGTVCWDLFTTSFAPHSVLAPFRLFNNVLRLSPQRFGQSRSTAPSGYLIVATV